MSFNNTIGNQASYSPIVLPPISVPPPELPLPPPTILASGIALPPISMPVPECLRQRPEPITPRTPIAASSQEPPTPPPIILPSLVRLRSGHTVPPISIPLNRTMRFVMEPVTPHPLSDESKSRNIPQLPSPEELSSPVAPMEEGRRRVHFDFGRNQTYTFEKWITPFYIHEESSVPENSSPDSPQDQPYSLTAAATLSDLSSSSSATSSSIS